MISCGQEIRKSTNFQTIVYIDGCIFDDKQEQYCRDDSMFF